MGKVLHWEKKQIGSTVLFIILHIRKQCCWREGGYFLEGRPRCDLPFSPHCLDAASLTAETCKPNFKQGKECLLVIFFLLHPFSPTSLHIAKPGLILSPLTFNTCNIMVWLNLQRSLFCSSSWKKRDSHTFRCVLIHTHDVKEFLTKPSSVVQWWGQLPWFSFFICLWQPGQTWTSLLSLLIWQMIC